MKKATSISRIVTCVIASLYTLLACFHLGEEARYKCMKIMPNADDAYELMFDRITPEAWFDIISAVALLALCAVAEVFLFRKGISSAVIAATSTVASAIYGMSLNTMLSEFTLWREFMRWLSLEDALAASLSVKPTLAVLCIAAAVCYAVLYLVSYKKPLTVGEDLNEQNS